MNPLLSISKEVQHALDNNLPVVALESTIISHGMPYPQNVEMAKTVELSATMVLFQQLSLSWMENTKLG